MKANDVLLSTLNKIKKEVDKTGKDIDFIVKEDPSVLSPNLPSGDVVS